MAVRPTREERKAETRRRILAAALEVFLERGFHAATLDEIAAAAGYTKGAVYSSFESKDELFLAVLDDQVLERRALYVEASRRARTFEEAARAHGRLLAELSRREPRWVPLVVEFWTHASRDPALRAAASAQHERILDAITELVTELGHRFDVEWTIPPRELVRAATAFGRGIALERLLDPSSVPPEAFEERFLAFVEGHVRHVGKETAR